MKPKNFFVFFSLLSAIAINGCATPYQKTERNFFDSNKHGYEDKKISQTIYSVKFVARSNTPLKVIDQYLQRRSAEITLEKKYDYFDPNERIQSDNDGHGPILMTQIITLYKEGEQPKGAFQAKAVLEKTKGKE